MNRTTLAAIAFVLIWSTGFIVARSIVDRVEPNLFLAVRFALCTLLLAGWMAWRRLPLPDRRTVALLLLVGSLVQGVYLGAGFWAVSAGLQPGLMSLVGALQPPLTALVAARLAWSDERVTRGTWLGLALGVAGVALAVGPALGTGASEVAPGVAFVALVSVLAITAGTLLQRSGIARTPVITASAVQSTGGLLVALSLVTLLGERHFVLDATSLGALAWAVLVLSIGGFTLLMWLVRTGGATRASSLLFLSPPLAAILAKVLFDDALGPVQVAGFALALTGVVIAQRS